MQKIILSDVEAIFLSLKNIRDNNELSFNIAFKIDQTTDILLIHVQRLAIEKNKLIKKFGTPVKKLENEQITDGEIYQISETNRVEFEQKLAELLNVEIDITMFYINFKDLAEADLKINKDVNLTLLKKYL